MGYRLLQACLDMEDYMACTRHAVLLVLCRHADDFTGENCFPSVSQISQKAHLGERVIPKILTDLKNAGWISWKQKNGCRRYYTVNLQKIFSTPSFNSDADKTPALGAAPALDPTLRALVQRAAPAQGTKADTVERSASPAWDSRADNVEQHATPAPGAPEPLHAVRMTPAPGAPEDLNKRTFKRTESACATETVAPALDSDFFADAPKTSIVPKTDSQKRGCRIENTALDPKVISGEFLAEGERVCRELGKTIDLHREYESFFDYWKSAPGKNAIKLDWLATWRNWVRKARTLPMPMNRNGGASMARETWVPRVDITPEKRARIEANRKRKAEMLAQMQKNTVSGRLL